MAKLSLRQKLEFWRKNRIWLKQIDKSSFESFDIHFYKGKDNLVFASGEFNNENQIVAITSMRSAECITKVYCEDYDVENKIGYMFGKKGIFCKNGEDASWEPIYIEPTMKQLIYNSSLEVAIICADSKCIFLKIKDGSVKKLKEINDVSIYMINHQLIKCFNCIDDGCFGNMEIQLKNKDGSYSYCYIRKGGFYYSTLKFDFNNINMLLEGKIVKAYHENNDEEIIVSLSDGVILQHEKLNKEIENNYKVINKRFYLVVKQNQVEYCDVIFKDDRIIKTLGEIPFLNYTFIKTILGHDYYKARCKNGCIILAINPDSVKYKFYEDAIDINISDSILFENGNVMQLKAIAVFEKEVEA